MDISLPFSILIISAAQWWSLQISVPTENRPPSIKTLNCTHSNLTGVRGKLTLTGKLASWLHSGKIEVQCQGHFFQSKFWMDVSIFVAVEQDEIQTVIQMIYSFSKMATVVFYTLVNRTFTNETIICQWINPFKCCDSVHIRIITVHNVDVTRKRGIYEYIYSNNLNTTQIQDAWLLLPPLLTHTHTHTHTHIQSPNSHLHFQQLHYTDHISLLLLCDNTNKKGQTGAKRSENELILRCKLRLITGALFKSDNRARSHTLTQTHTGDWLAGRFLSLITV